MVSFFPKVFIKKKKKNAAVTFVVSESNEMMKLTYYDSDQLYKEVCKYTFIYVQRVCVISQLIN